MHPTQHSTVNRPEPRILRTHRLITRGVAEDKADAFVAAAVESLQSLASKQAAKPLHIAPPAKRSLQELLKQASETAKAFTPRKATLNTEAA
jgi:hypothetical protein